MFLVVAIVALTGAAVAGSTLFRSEERVPSATRQACALPPSWLTRVQRGYDPQRSGQVSVLPVTPAYLASGAGGWSHSGPWPYLQRIPIVFYAPGVLPARGAIDRPVTTADIAPTLARIMGVSIRSDGKPMREVAPPETVTGHRPRLILTIVYDGGGWNVLDQWPGDWPVLKTMMEEGTLYTNATVGSSPSVTPAIHTTLGTGVYPDKHGITGIPVRDEEGTVVDAFLKGDSSRFLEVPTLAERWDEANDNRPLVGMVGYEPWHLGMIGKGAEKPGGDKDDAVWLDIETNDWITNEDHYRLPSALADTPGLQADLDRLDAADGARDDAWGEHAWLDEANREHWEETPAFIAYHTRAMMNLIQQEGYGADGLTDLLFTNYKQIDRVGHYFNMASEEVHDSLIATDDQLGVILRSLNRIVGRGKWAVVLTADHGQQPDASDVAGYGIDPGEIAADIDERFGPITRAVWPTEVFLFDDVMEERGVTVGEVADFLANYRVADNTIRPDTKLLGAGEFGADDKLFAMAIPARLLPALSCKP